MGRAFEIFLWNIKSSLIVLSSRDAWGRREISLICFDCQTSWFQTSSLRAWRWKFEDRIKRNLTEFSKLPLKLYPPCYLNQLTNRGANFHLLPSSSMIFTINLPIRKFNLPLGNQLPFIALPRDKDTRSLCGLLGSINLVDPLRYTQRYPSFNPWTTLSIHCPLVRYSRRR